MTSLRASLLTFAFMVAATASALTACGGTQSTSSATTPPGHSCRAPHRWNGHACVRTLNTNGNLGRTCPPGQHREDGGCLDNGQSNAD